MAYREERFGAKPLYDWLSLANLDDLGDVNLGAVTDGDIIRYNSATGKWESCAEPFTFTEIILTPATAAPSDTEGGIFYKSSDNKFYGAIE